MPLCDILALIATSWHSQAPASEDEIAMAQTMLGHMIPNDYQSFLRWSNGGEGWIGNRYFCPWPVTQLKELNDGYLIDKYLPGFVVVGDDLGAYCYAFDYHEAANEPSFTRVPYDDLEVDAVEPMGDSFLDALERWLQ